MELLLCVVANPNALASIVTSGVTLCAMEAGSLLAKNGDLLHLLHCRNLLDIVVLVADDFCGFSVP